MSKLSQIKASSLLKFFVKQGFVVSRQVGSHARLIHNKPIAPGTFNSILKQAQMDRKTFLKLFKK